MVPPQYTDLSNVIGSSLPDFRGRFPAMAGNPGASGSYIVPLGDTSGNMNIGISQIPAHKHDIKVFYGDSGYVPDGSPGATGGTDNPQLNSFTSQDGGGLGAFSIIGTGHGSGTSHTIGFGTVNGVGGGTELTGGGQSYAPPYLSINFIIYAGLPDP